jgi:hypothetical protein
MLGKYRYILPCPLLRAGEKSNCPARSERLREEHRVPFPPRRGGPRPESPPDRFPTNPEPRQGLGLATREADWPRKGEKVVGSPKRLERGGATRERRAFGGAALSLLGLSLSGTNRVPFQVDC